MERKKFNGFLLLITISTALVFCLSSSEISSSRRQVKLGNENFIKNFPAELQNERLGLVINHTSVLPGGKSLIQSLLEKGHKVRAIFSPEHGFSGFTEGGKEILDSEHKGIKIFSLYGKTRKPTPKQIREIDAFVYDIQDVGTRFYTYITTLKYVLEAASKAKTPVYVMDRPNPAGGVIIEGPLLLPEYQSFIGAFPIPVRYGLTSGELAMMMKGEGWVPEEGALHVVKMEGWRRNYFWKDTGLPWIPPSPNMPTPETAIIYPGTGLFEAINLNEGRGTPSPFLQFGAPWLDPLSIIKSLSEKRSWGIELDSADYSPLSLPGKALHPLYENETCHGIRVRITEEEKFCSLRFAIALIKALKERHPDKISPSPRRLNLMFGNDLLVRFLKGGITYKRLMEEMEEEELIFQEKRKKYLLY
ncbi:MAG: DUF1343 domain-containing protein [Candidatus Aminicenantes bacterium]|nr:MAG: DUF1343 domain-containing protein [Candidatus Aminicenantes bacterium]